MKRTIVVILTTAVCCVATSMAFAAEKKCEYFVKVESGAYGAVNLNALRTLRTATENHDDAKIAEMLKKRQIKKIDTDKKLCVVDTAHNHYAKVVLLPGDDTQYHVDDKATTVVE